MDEHEASIVKSDFTFLFNPPGKEHSRDQVQPWSKNNSISKQSIGESGHDLSLPQILALKQIQKEKSTELENQVGSIDTLNEPSSKRIDPKN